MIPITLKENQHIYIASDQHFGAPTQEKSLVREKRFVKWLYEIEPTAGAIFIIGDLFDFWFEYKKAVPKGFTRTLGTLALFADKGIPIYFFVGNHDLWVNDYFEKELGIHVFHQPQDFIINGKTLHIGHGDGLGDGDKGYKFLKKIFTNPVCKWFFRWLHPDIGIAVAQHLSVKNKLISGDEDVAFLGEDKEDLIQYTLQQENRKHRDYYIFGHRHLPMVLPLKNETTTYVNTGDWVSYFSYVTINTEGTLLLHYYN